MAKNKLLVLSIIPFLVFSGCKSKEQSIKKYNDESVNVYNGSL